MGSLFARLFGRSAPVDPPLSARERAALDHRARALERRVREARKRADRHGCSTCLQAHDPVGVALARKARLLEDELASIERRLARG